MNQRLNKTIEDLIQIRANELKELPTDILFEAMTFIDSVYAGFAPYGYTLPPDFNSIVKESIERAAIWLAILEEKDAKLTMHRRVLATEGVKCETANAIEIAHDLAANLMGMLHKNSREVRSILAVDSDTDVNIRETAFQCLFEQLEAVRQNDNEHDKLNKAVSLLFFIFAQEGEDPINSLLFDFLI